MPTSARAASDPARWWRSNSGFRNDSAYPRSFFGRPGTYGSGGKHYTIRGRQIEADLVNAALDGLKKRYGIAAWALGGHSGGGTLVAEMLGRRDDLHCAVISSGASAYRTYLQARGLLKPGEKLTRFDPYDALDSLPADPHRRIFVIGDPRETNVPFSVFRGPEGWWPCRLARPARTGE